MAANMVKEWSYSQLGLNMWGILSLESEMEKAPTRGQINLTIKESLEMGKFMEKVANSSDELGTLKWFNGNEYTGTWKNNQRFGKGRMAYANGAVYEGEFIGSRKHGKGTMKFADGRFYEGMFVAGKPSGKGKSYSL